MEVLHLHNGDIMLRLPLPFEDPGGVIPALRGGPVMAGEGTHCCPEEAPATGGNQ
ncbi:MAG: hypothetical protein ACMG6E_08125 [Candidatus Roizmanbacteria bacterium]